MRSRAGRPVILAACDDPGDLRRIEREPRTRYEADYRIVFEGSAGAGLKALQHLGEAGYEVALVLADQQMRGASMPGVFAVGDARYRSVKRVASAVGEGSIAIQQVHEYLSRV